MKFPDALEEKADIFFTLSIKDEFAGIALKAEVLKYFDSLVK